MTEKTYAIFETTLKVIEELESRRLTAEERREVLIIVADNERMSPESIAYKWAKKSASKLAVGEGVNSQQGAKNADLHPPHASESKEKVMEAVQNNSKTITITCSVISALLLVVSMERCSNVHTYYGETNLAALYSFIFSVLFGAGAFFSSKSKKSIR